MFGQCTRNIFDNVKLSLPNCATLPATKQKINKDKITQMRELNVKDQVWVWNELGQIFENGNIQKISGVLSYIEDVAHNPL